MQCLWWRLPAGCTRPVLRGPGVSLLRRQEPHGHDPLPGQVGARRDGEESSSIKMGHFGRKCWLCGSRVTTIDLVPATEVRKMAELLKNK